MTIQEKERARVAKDVRERKGLITQSNKEQELGKELRNFHKKRVEMKSEKQLHTLVTWASIQSREWIEWYDNFAERIYTEFKEQASSITSLLETKLETLEKVADKFDISTDLRELWNYLYEREMSMQMEIDFTLMTVGPEQAGENYERILSLKHLVWYSKHEAQVFKTRSDELRELYGWYEPQEKELRELCGIFVHWYKALEKIRKLEMKMFIADEKNYRETRTGQTSFNH